MHNLEDLEPLLQSLETLEHIDLDEIPGIDLYMDQVTTFMESRLKTTKRYPEDKVLTKTMINNYAKNDLLPPPVKKKYSKEHILLLAFIYYLKSFLSIGDIQALLKPLTEHYFSGDGALTLEDIYQEIIDLQDKQAETFRRDMEAKIQEASQSFSQAPAEEKDYLQLFSFICSLSFDVYLKKQVIERIIDGIREETGDKGKKGKH